MSQGSLPRGNICDAVGEGRAFFPPRGPVFDLALALLVLLTVGMSGLTLMALGLPYQGTGGGFLGNVHPATFYAFALLTLAFLTQANPVSKLIEIFEQNPALLFYLATLALVSFHASKVVKTPITNLVDTFLLPAFVFLLLREQSQRRRTMLAWIVHIFMFANACLGLAEFALGFRLTPLVSDGQVLSEDWRSSAFLGYPLSNALHTGAYLLILVLGAARQLPLPVRALFFATNLAAMMVFAGRTASIMLLLILAALAAIKFAKILNGARFNPIAGLAGLVGTVGAAIGGIFVLQSGILSLFLRRFTHDADSAQTRLDMFELFKHLNWSDIVWGPDDGQIVTLQHYYGIEFGIESFWISFILTYGLVVSLIFFAGFLTFIAKILTEVGPGKAWWLLYFMVTITSSLSLGSKTSLLAVEVIFLLVLLPATQVQQSLRPPLSQTLQKRFTPRHGDSRSLAYPTKNGGAE